MQSPWESGLGNVQAGVDNVGVVLTHPCLMRADTRCIRARSFNGSSLEQWMQGRRLKVASRLVSGCKGCTRRARIAVALVASGAAASSSWPLLPPFQTNNFTIQGLALVATIPA